MNGNDLKRALANIREGADLLEDWTTDEDQTIDRLQKELEKITFERDDLLVQLSQALNHAA